MPHRNRVGSGQRWDEGYGVTAWFLIYCDGLKEGFTAELNNKMRYYYSDELFVELLGKSVDELWRDYKAMTNFLAFFSLYSLLFFTISQSRDISTTQYKVINNVPNIPGGSRFDQEIGVPYTLDIMKTINQFIYKTFEQPDPSDRRPVPVLTVYISDFPDAWGYTNGPNINISAPAIEHFPPGLEQARWNFKSLMYHEMTHIFQWFGTGTENGTAPGGLTEGVADYIKIKSGFYDPDATDKPGSGERWDEGYGVTAWFLIYCDGLKKDTWRLSNGEAQVLPCSDTAEPFAPGGAGLSSSVSDVSQTATLPPLHDLDVAVIEFLPPEVVSEINDMYGGKLLGFISEYKGKVINANIMHAAPLTIGEGVAADETESLRAHLVASNTITGANEELQCDESSVHVMSGSVSQNNLMPTSLSQVDCSVLQQLPEELRKDIIELLPPHRTPEIVKGSSSNVIDNQAEFGESKNDLWIGSPPLWVDKFETSKCCMLNKFAKTYQFGTGGCLSFVLQRMISEIHLPLGMGIEGLDNAVNCLSELFKQYVELKVATDIEEIYLCICLLRR
ncbi:hypothetical protein RD792_016200 [Penstemon davidsonii]|uniref:Uncharacterized protein n=1 Tax=Penstemon davidsonii TaxID=160366 RepID=A0ABR0CKB3_9LAMI|nr:hypothetical protein RD792_016200 [Penstemon davidsonii]